mmetsp:Transcript_18334/g.25693  ORF Transcript_18334/g.25693 Transcript_18334/m.25693 type:complete len:264 (+) Transcript_18334:41-832(+)
MSNNHNTLCIITGASRGLGKFITAHFAEHFPSTHFILIARNGNELNDSKNSITQIDANASVDIYSVDLGDLNNLKTNVDKVFEKIDTSKYKQSFLINNAGSVGPLVYLSEIDDLSAIKQAVDFNVTSFIWLSVRFLKAFRNLSTSVFVVNLSSLAAVKPFQSWGVYCAGKAARDMLTAVIAEETENTKATIKSLNYAPGPCDTDMQKDVRELCGHQSTRETFAQMKAKGTLVDPSESSLVLVKLLKSNEFQSGAHIDYFDVKK